MYIHTLENNTLVQSDKQRAGSPVKILRKIVRLLLGYVDIQFPEKGEYSSRPNEWTPIAIIYNTR